MVRIIVLIETLWNVKENIRAEPADELPVLIETLWNVKVSGLQKH